MASPEQHKEILLALGEIQASIEGISLDAQAIREYYWGRQDEEDIAPPEWASQGRPEIDGGAYPPPDDRDPRYYGSSTALVVISVLVAMATTLAILLYLIT